MGLYCRELAGRCGFSPEDSGDIRLALEEALMNIRKHAYNQNDHRPIQIEFETKENSLEIRIRDYGRRIAPGKITGHTLHWLRENGIAVAYIEKIMDRVNYVTIFSRGSMLVMEKNFK